LKRRVQIPCLNEEETLPATLRDIPSQIAGIGKMFRTGCDAWRSEQHDLAQQPTANQPEDAA